MLLKEVIEKTLENMHYLCSWIIVMFLLQYTLFGSIFRHWEKFAFLYQHEFSDFFFTLTTYFKKQNSGHMRPSLVLCLASAWVSWQKVLCILIGPRKIIVWDPRFPFFWKFKKLTIGSSLLSIAEQWLLCYLSVNRSRNGERAVEADQSKCSWLQLISSSKGSF
jgi:hypothetical protein